MTRHLAIVGCGAMSALFSEYLASEARVTRSYYNPEPMVDYSFLSRNVAKAEEYCHNYSGKGVYTNYEEVLNDPTVDAVYIAVPHDSHEYYATEALHAEKPVLLEKPIADTLASARRIVDMARDTDTPLMIAENYLYIDRNVEAKRRIENGDLGEIYQVQIQEVAPINPLGWRLDPAQTGGGVFVDGGIHKLALFQYLIGRPNYVSGSFNYIDHDPDKGEHSGVALLRHQDTIGIITHCWAPNVVVPKTEVAIVGSKNSLQYRIEDAPQAMLSLHLGNRRHRTLPYSLGDYQGLRAMTRHFFRCLETGDPFRTPGVLGLQHLEDVERVYDSALEVGDQDYLST